MLDVRKARLSLHKHTPESSERGRARETRLGNSTIKRTDYTEFFAQYEPESCDDEEAQKAELSDHSTSEPSTTLLLIQAKRSLFYQRATRASESFYALVA